MTALLEYIDIYYVYEYNARYFITLLILCLKLYQAPNETEIIGVSLQITHSFVKLRRVSNTCNKDFHLFIVLGYELLIHCIYLALYLGHT